MAFRDTRVSLAVGLAIAGGLAELLLDAIPGIVLRLQTKPASTYFQHRPHYPWSLTPLHDQQLAGGVLWIVAEVLDLPFLILLFVAWTRADAREAADIDAMLEVERTARTATSPAPATGTPTLGPADTPSWLTDPQLRDRWVRAGQPRCLIDSLRSSRRNVAS